MKNRFSVAAKFFCVAVLICFASAFAFIPKKIKKNKITVFQRNKSDCATEERYDNIFCNLFAFEPATYPQGIEGWLKYLSDSTCYPEIAQVNETEGKIRIRFTVEKDGSIANVEALNILKDSLTEEAIRVIKASPKWIPARNKGITVTDHIVQQITFMLNDEKENKTSCSDSIIWQKSLPIL